MLSSFRWSIGCVPVVAKEGIETAAATERVPSTPGGAGGASGAAGAAGAEMATLEVEEMDDRACCSKRASRIGMAMIGSMALASRSGTVLLEVVVVNSLTTSSSECLALREDVKESNK